MRRRHRRSVLAAPSRRREDSSWPEVWRGSTRDGRHLVRERRRRRNAGRRATRAGNMRSVTSLDFPITSSTEDSLGRDGLALALSREIARLDARRGAVVAITGTWGSGKSSLLNLTAAHLRAEDVEVLEFN